MSLLSKKQNNKYGRKRSSRGAAALEFALIAAPFFFMIFALIEIMAIFFVQTTLEAAVAAEARRVRTGQTQSVATPVSRADFKQAVCDKMYGMAKCSTRLFVMVQAFGATAPTTQPATPWADGALVIGSSDDEPYQSSSPGDIVMVRAYYVWPLFTPGMTAALSNFSGGTFGSYNRILAATTAFRNEPFN